MKITSVDVIQCHLDGNSAFRPVCCRINTDEGIYGYGEAAVAYGTAAPAAVGMIRDLAPLVIGQDPLNIEAMWDAMQRTTFWGQGGGTIINAGISALDMALWDIKGKIFNAPVYKLLGGKCTEKLRSYASQLQLGWGHDLRIGWGGANEDGGATEMYIENAQRAMEEGYDAVKVDILNYNREGFAHTPAQLTKPLTHEVIRLADERLAAIRETVGPDCDIIIENHCGTDAVSAVKIAEVAEKYDIFFYEEPVSPLNPGLTKEVASRTNIPIAGGERIYTRWGYIPFFNDHSIKVIQPDIGNCGGISEAKKICDMAHAYDVSVQAHVCGGPIGVAASLQLEAALPNFCIHEQHTIECSSFIREQGLYDYQPVNGYIEIPELPGLGQELSEKALKLADIITVK